ATNRKTMSGQTLGPDEQITVDEALFAITMGAAETLKMETDVGSITPGKFADFAILSDDPTAGPAAALKDIDIKGTVLAGEVQLI
ncbi:amidohydrolase family protein, partial [Cognatishimia sp.]|uniref:amidohydrolase family protein n=1 Tax=Cognatishimia sp. TaxID=2211648 RepID=UPI003517EA6D